jgi:hypothetical protein
MLDATEIADGPPTPEYPTQSQLPQSETIRPPMKFPDPPRGGGYQSPVTAMAASIPSARRRGDPNARVKRIGIAAGAALLLGVGVLLAVSGGDEPEETETPEPTEPIATTSPGERDAGTDGVVVLSADAAVTGDAAPVLSTVEIVVRPPGAQVTLAGRDTLGAPAQFSGLAAGNYFVRVDHDGYVPVERTISVEAGQYRTVELALVPLPTRPEAVDAGAGEVVKIRRKDERPGRLVVRTSPYSIAYLAGRKFDTTPFTRELKPGSYTFTFKSPGYPAQRRSVRIRPGKKKKLIFDLKK